MEFLMWLENSSFAVWERESLSLFAYPFFLVLHTIGLAFLVGVSAGICLRILGVASRLPLAPMERYYGLLWLGFWVNALSGVVLLPTAAVNFLTVEWIFYIKLGAIAVAMASMAMIRREVFLRGNADAAPLSAKARTLARTALGFWALAILSGRLMAYSNFVTLSSAGAFIVLTIVVLAVGLLARPGSRARRQLRHAA